MTELSAPETVLDPVTGRETDWLAFYIPTGGGSRPGMNTWDQVLDYTSQGWRFEDEDTDDTTAGPVTVVLLSPPEAAA